MLISISLISAVLAGRDYVAVTPVMPRMAADKVCESYGMKLANIEELQAGEKALRVGRIKMAWIGSIHGKPPKEGYAYLLRRGNPTTTAPRAAVLCEAMGNNENSSTASSASEESIQDDTSSSSEKLKKSPIVQSREDLDELESEQSDLNEGKKRKRHRNGKKRRRNGKKKRQNKKKNLDLSAIQRLVSKKTSSSSHSSSSSSVHQKRRSACRRVIKTKCKNKPEKKKMKKTRRGRRRVIRRQSSPSPSSSSSSSAQPSKSKPLLGATHSESHSSFSLSDTISYSSAAEQFYASSSDGPAAIFRNRRFHRHIRHSSSSSSLSVEIPTLGGIPLVTAATAAKETPKSRSNPKGLRDELAKTTQQLNVASRHVNMEALRAAQQAKAQARREQREARKANRRAKTSENNKRRGSTKRPTKTSPTVEKTTTTEQKDSNEQDPPSHHSE